MRKLKQVFSLDFFIFNQTGSRNWWKNEVFLPELLKKPFVFLQCSSKKVSKGSRGLGKMNSLDGALNHYITLQVRYLELPSRVKTPGQAC